MMEIELNNLDLSCSGIIPTIQRTKFHFILLLYTEVIKFLKIKTHSFDL